MREDARSSFVLSTTVTETILLLFFLLLLLLAFFYRQAEAQRESLRTQLNKAQREADSVRGLRTEIEALKRRIEAIVQKAPPNKADELRNVLVSLPRLEAEVAQKREEKDALLRDVAMLKSLEAKIREGLKEKEIGEQFITKATEAAKCERAAQRIPVLESKSAREEKELLEANRRNRELQDRYSACMRERGGGKGGDYIACWRDANNKIEYAFEVMLSESGLHIERKWPDARAAEIQRFSSATSLVGRTVSVSEFLLATRELFYDSEQKACRYYIVITGRRAEMNPARFSDFQRAQDHFYIYDNVR